MAVGTKPDMNMMKNQNRISNEVFIYILILSLAFLLRFILLGKLPLVNSEASFALQAWQLWKGDSLVIGSQVSYLSITKALFSIFGSGNFLARFWPAFSGSLIVLVPFLIKDRFGRLPALLLAFGLALDPGLVAVSRIAGGPMSALVFLLLALAVFHVGHLPLAMFLVFLGLFSGPAFWLGTAILGLTILLSGILGIINPAPYIKERLSLVMGENKSSQYKPGDFALPLLMVIVLGSFFLTRIQGLSAWSGSVPEFFSSWLSLPEFRFPGLLLHLVVSSPMILVFGGLGFYSAWKESDRQGKISSIWFGIALIITLVFPGRRPVDMIWLVIPLWISTARELIRINNLVKGSWLVYLLGGLIGILIAMNWLTFTGMIFQIDKQRAVLLQWGLIGASLALVLLAMTIIASEWGWDSAKKGLSLGTASMLLLFTLSVLAQEAYLRAGDPRSLWSDGSGAGQMDLLLDTVGDISISQTGRWDSIQGGVIRANDNLRWTLRGLSNFEYFDTYQSENLLPILITSEQDQYLIPLESYRGQDFVSRTKPGWQGLIPEDWISWIAFRQGPIENEHIILWVRGDLLIGED